MTGTGLIVKRLEFTDHNRWDRFVYKAERGTFYHLSGWKTLIENELRHPTFYMYCEKDGEITAVLPLSRVKSWLFGDALISIPFLVYGGPVSTSDESLEALVSAAKELAVELGVDYLELRNQVPLAGEWHSKDKYVTFRKRIDPDPDTNLMAIPRKQRAMIRKGIKAELVTEIDTNTDRLYAAMLICKRNLGTPFFGRRWLQAIKEEFGEQAEITTATHEGATVCSVMSFRFRDEILPYYGGGGDVARVLKGNDYMYWAVLEKACRDGVAVFDYGRSSVGSGAYRFKKHWGFEPEPLHYQYFLVNADSPPDVNPTNPRYRSLINIWKKLPLLVAGLIGPSIARRLA
jgi:FemAB-related protein (PEP-CTERM system-associated)